MLKGGGGGRGHTQFWGSFNMGAQGFSHTERERKMFPPFKQKGRGGGLKLLPCLEGGVGVGDAQKLQTDDFPIS